MPFLEDYKLFIINWIKNEFNNYIDREELGIEYFLLQPDDCDCGDSPEEMKEWHVYHINKCLRTFLQVAEFEESFKSIIKKSLVRFEEQKKKVIERIFQKAQDINYKKKVGYDYRVPEFYIRCRCTNNQLIKEEEQKHLTYLEDLAKTWQKQELKNRQQEEELERIRQEEIRVREEEERRKKLAEELKQKEEELKKKVDEEVKREKEKTHQEQEDNNGDNPSPKPPQPQEKPEPTDISHSKILKKFAFLPNFDTAEKIAALINPVKDDPKFLQRLKENNLSDLTSLIITKSPQEIIILVKRFEYDKEKKKDKKIREYYHLNSTDNLTDEQINNYLYHQAIGEIKNNLTTNKESHWDTYQNYYYIGLATLFIAFVFIIKIKARRLKKHI